MLNIGPLELMVILLVALIVVGPAKLPELGRQIGKGLREFRKVQDEVRDSIRMNLDDDDTPPRFPMRDNAPEPTEPDSPAPDGSAAAPKAGSDERDPEEPGPVRGAPDDEAESPASDQRAPE